MTEIVVAFRPRDPVPLCRVWFETGNPVCPLECEWIALQESGADRTTCLAPQLLTNSRILLLTNQQF